MLNRILVKLLISVHRCSVSKLEKTDFCEYCVGKRLADTETGASAAATELGGIFLDIFMSSMHAKELRVSEMDLNTCFT